MRYLALLLLVLTSAVQAQRLPPGTRIGVMKEAKAQMDSMADLTRKTQREQMGCIEVSIMDDTTFVIARIGRAKIDSTDKWYIYAKSVYDMCKPWQPTIHSHVDESIDFPSPIDSNTAALREVFGFILVVGRDAWKIKAYP